ncbi:MAG: hypothetical protein JW795_09985 [Chitinivibrionales bacterium]|nr:hypothetical protein [Chitinivibrionales bacterium]
MPNATVEQRQRALAAFLDYALTKPEVRIVTVKQILDWARKPVGLDGSPSSLCWGDRGRQPLRLVVTRHHRTFTIRGLVPAAGAAVRFCSLQGRQVGLTAAPEDGGRLTWEVDRSVAAGVYLLSIIGRGVSGSALITVE